MISKAGVFSIKQNYKKPFINGTTLAVTKE